MRRWIPVRARALLGLVAALVGFPPIHAQTEVTTYTPSRIHWKELDFKASKLGVKAHSVVGIRLVPTTDVVPSLLSVDGASAVMPKGDEVAEVVITTDVKGTRSVTTLLLEPASAAAIQRTQLFTGNKKNRSFLRTFRYLDDGVFIERRFPPDSGEPGPPSEWPVNNTRTIPFPESASGQPVSEAMALFYILSAADFARIGDELRFFSFDKPEVSEILVTVAQLVPWEVGYTEVSPAGERKLDERHIVARLTISGETVGEAEGSFEFLGLRGSVEIFADRELRIPVAARGRIPIVGKTTLGLDRVVIE